MENDTGVFLSTPASRVKILKGASNYEQYIILMNDSLQAENRTFRMDIKNLENRVEELEESGERDDRAKVYTKGLLKNFIEMDAMRKEVSTMETYMRDRIRGSVAIFRQDTRRRLQLYEFLMVIMLVGIYITQPACVLAMSFLIIASSIVAGEYTFGKFAIPDCNEEEISLKEMWDKIKAVMNSQDFLHEHIDLL